MLERLAQVGDRLVATAVVEPAGARGRGARRAGPAVVRRGRDRRRPRRRRRARPPGPAGARHRIAVSAHRSGRPRGAGRRVTKLVEHVKVVSFGAFIAVRSRRDRLRCRLPRGKAAAVTFDKDFLIVGRNLGLFLLVVFWIATAYWVFKDARRRIEDPWMVAMATVLGRDPAVPRARSSTCSSARPSTSRTSASGSSRSRRWRSGSRSATSTAPSVARRSTPSFLVCPVCTTKLKQACVNCKAAARGAVADLPVLRDARRDARRRSTSGDDLGRRRAAEARRVGSSRPMAVERTLILIKPDAVRARARRRDPRAHRAARLRASSRGKLLRVDRASSASGTTPSTRRSRSSASSSSFITSGPTLALVVEGEGAIATMRKTIGATNPADAEPGSIRGDLAIVDAEQPRPRLRLAGVRGARDRALVLGR